RMAIMCRAPGPVDVNPSPHMGHWIKVTVTPAAKETMVSGKGVYPEGTVILKQKFTDREATQSELFTGMRKREAGYNAEVGDWEFFTLDGAGKEVTSSGKMESCVDCHKPYKATDFVTRKYVAAK